MPRFSGTLGVGDVLVTREGPWWVSFGIRLSGLVKRHRPDAVNHVIVVHHVDPQGRWWGIEGRPGGVGWRDLTDISRAAATNANTGQPKTETQRFLIAVAAEKLLGTPYDWDAIAADARMAVKLWRASKDWADGETPGHVVCSSFADWAYEQVGLANPGGNAGTRWTTPGDWDFWISRQGWNSR